MPHTWSITFGHLHLEMIVSRCWIEIRSKVLLLNPHKLFLNVPICNFFIIFQHFELELLKVTETIIFGLLFNFGHFMAYHLHYLFLFFFLKLFVGYFAIDALMNSVFSPILSHWLTLNQLFKSSLNSIVLLIINLFVLCNSYSIQYFAFNIFMLVFILKSQI